MEVNTMTKQKTKNKTENIRMKTYIFKYHKEKEIKTNEGEIIKTVLRSNSDITTILSYYLFMCFIPISKRIMSTINIWRYAKSEEIFAKRK